MMRYFVEVQLAFAILVALHSAFVLALAGICVSFEERNASRGWAKAFLTDDGEEIDLLLPLSGRS
jgi:hypothetical protein